MEKRHGMSSHPCAGMRENGLGGDVMMMQTTHFLITNRWESH